MGCFGWKTTTNIIPFIFHFAQEPQYKVGLGWHDFVPIRLCYNTWVPFWFVLQFDRIDYCDFNYCWIQLWSYLALPFLEVCKTQSVSILKIKFIWNGRHLGCFSLSAVPLKKKCNNNRNISILGLNQFFKLAHMRISFFPTPNIKHVLFFVSY